ncbi:phosphonate C-P lyase system protein PhnG [Pigmentiphaga aceris]|uniref:Phosphonate C-P lyase system protein PhnG n=1 Tax=Pigmentiphaga aceris TaxID=1940612 RepID=A0A5C0AV95_9BURK|nr:phosphonate C-P lyase system protein PhnG [Pigmentiphaga aceris]QEI06352.1 phosphonate C-P lyase system protein PhnG [Pigmentiphaga aceris]
MFQASDSAGTTRPLDRTTSSHLTRPQWMALLARAPIDLLEPALGSHASVAPQWLRMPETGLMMVQGRAGGTGERFNLGEVTVTRCALRLPDAVPGQAAVGVAYVMGRSHRHARLAALADALLQDPAKQAALDAALLTPVRAHLAQLRTQRQARAQSTKVEFFTVARESSGIEGDQEEDA